MYVQSWPEKAVEKIPTDPVLLWLFVGFNLILTPPYLVHCIIRQPHILRGTYTLPEQALMGHYRRFRPCHEPTST